MLDLLRCLQRRPTDTRIVRGALWFPPGRVSVQPRCIRLRFRAARWAKRRWQHILALYSRRNGPHPALIDRHMLDEPQTVYVGLIGLGLLSMTSGATSALRPVDHAV